MDRTLLVRRHAESTANAARRIQGRSRQAGLTPTGRAEAARWARTLDSVVGGVSGLWSSDALRARITAAFATRRIQLSAQVTPLLAEVGAGLLEGRTHEEAARLHPEYYATWIARGDLDGIPGAEGGRRLQARALAFLTIAGRADPGTAVVVTHAGFLRCLVNTAAARDRQHPVAVGYGDIHELHDPWLRLSPTALGPAWRPAVYLIDTGPGGRYVVKTAPTGELARYVLVQDAVGAEVLAADTASGVVVRAYVPGAPIPHRIDAVLEWRLLDFYRSESDTINRAVTCDLRQGLPTLADRVRSVLRQANSEASEGVRALLADSRVSKLVEDESTVADFDLHRDNTLLDGDTLRKIDYDALCLGPRRWPLACAIVGASALYPSDHANFRPHDNLDAELALLVRLRLLLGLAHFLTGARVGAGPDAERFVALYRNALAKGRRPTSPRP